MDRSDTYTSDSGSEYFFTSDGVYRRSNHWGKGIKTCNWILENDGTNMRGSKRIGYAKWSDFVHNPLKIIANQEYDNEGNATKPVSDIGITTFDNQMSDNGRHYV